MRQLVVVLLLLLSTQLSPEVTYQAYLPAIAAQCPDQSEKAGLTRAFRGGKFNYNWLCWTGYGHDWDASYNTHEPPMLWGDFYDGIDLRAAFLATVPTSYSGLLLWANEPDLADQANMTPAACGAMGVWLMNNYPNAKPAGPMPSAADDGSYSLQCYQEFIDQGGNPDYLAFGSVHIYPRGSTIDSASARIDEYYNNYLQPSGQGNKLIYVTEIGLLWYVTDPAMLENWLVELEADPRVVRYYVFNPYLPYGSYFRPLFDWDTGTPTDLGYVFKRVVGG